MHETTNPIYLEKYEKYHQFLSSADLSFAHSAVSAGISYITSHVFAGIQRGPDQIAGKTQSSLVFVARIYFKLPFCLICYCYKIVISNQADFYGV